MGGDGENVDSEKGCKKGIGQTIEDQMRPVEGVGEHRELLAAGFKALPFPEMSLSLPPFPHCTFPALCPILSHLELLQRR